MSEASSANAPHDLGRSVAGEQGETPFAELALPVLHAVTNDDIASRSEFLTVAERVMCAGKERVAVHLRASQMSGRRLFDVASRLADVQQASGSWLVVNDRVDVALVVGARGAQLTSRSLLVADARRAAAGLRVGASVHSIPDGLIAASQGADWLVAGHVFATPSHPAEDGRGLGFVERLARMTARPVIAIGGVRPEHLEVLCRSGAYGVAAIRGIWDAADAEAAVMSYLSSHDAHAGH